MTELILLEGLAVSAISADLTELADNVQTYVENSHAPSTRRAYSSDWRLFTQWCQDYCLESLPALPTTVALYMAYLIDIGRKMPTIERKLAAIHHYHVVAGFPLTY